MAKLPTYKEMAQEVAERALDECEYEGKTLREWIEIIMAQPAHGTDTISRQAAIDALCAVCGKDCDKSKFVYNAPQDEQVIICPEHYCLCTLPPAEPQIIRCKDCKNWDTTWTNDFSPNYHYCPMVDCVRKEDWFCADAERRTGWMT